jgi:magnesium transporter
VSAPSAAPSAPPSSRQPQRRLLDEHGDVIEDVTRADVEARLHDGRFFWLDLPAVGDEELEWMRDVFSFHPLAIDDAAHFGERPKLEEFDGYVTLVMYGSGAGVATDGSGDGAGAGPGGPEGPVLDPGAVDPDAIGSVSEVHCFVGARYVVTVHRGSCPAFATMLARAHARRAPISDPTRLFYRIADTLVDSFYPVLASLDDRIDALQSAVIERPRNSQLAELLDYRSALISLRKVISPQRDLFASLSSGVTDLPGFDDEGLRYLRDVYDHLIRLSDLIDAYRDLMSGTTDAYLSVVSNQLNVVMKQLTIISTVFLPLSFLTGFFGQNFGFLVDHVGSWETFVGLGLGTEAVAVGLLYALFRSRGWIGSDT